MVRTPSYDQNGMKKGAWSPEEDQLLRSYITTNGPSKWRDLPNLAGLKRCGKSCRLRWMNYLRPNIKHGNYTKQEEDLIMQLHQKYGNKWAIIASKLSGRTDNEIKNYWHTHLKKRVQPPRPITTSRSKIDPKQVDINVSDQPEKRQIKSNIHNDINILESSPLLFPEEMISTTTSTPISREVSTSTPSSLGISTIGFDDDLGLEEFINSSELFAEMSPLISPFPLNHEMENNDRRYATASTLGGEYSGTSRTMDVYGELQVADGDIWRNWHSDNNDVLLSSGVNYYDDDVLEFFCNQEGI